MFMKNIRTFNDVDIFITSFMNKWGLTLLRYSLGIIYIWFGILKPFGLSPAQELVENTVYWFENPKTFVPILGWWEVIIGITMCIKPLIRVSIFLLFIQMPGTFLPLILLPDICFTSFPFGLTLEGQYIIKNLLVIKRNRNFLMHMYLYMHLRVYMWRTVEIKLF